MTLLSRRSVGVFVFSSTCLLIAAVCFVKVRSFGSVARLSQTYGSSRFVAASVRKRATELEDLLRRCGGVAMNTNLAAPKIVRCCCVRTCVCVFLD